MPNPSEDDSDPQVSFDSTRQNLGSPLRARPPTVAEQSQRTICNSQAAALCELPSGASSSCLGGRFVMWCGTWNAWRGGLGLTAFLLVLYVAPSTSIRLLGRPDVVQRDVLKDTGSVRVSHPVIAEI